MGFEGRPADLDLEGQSEHHAMKCLWSVVKNTGQELQMPAGESWLHPAFQCGMLPHPENEINSRTCLIKFYHV